LTDVLLKKENKKPKKIEIDASVEEIVLDLKRPRLITIFGVDMKGKANEWHLKITAKNKLALL